MKKRMLALFLALALSLTACAAAPNDPAPPENEDPDPVTSEALLPEGSIEPLELPVQLPSFSGLEDLEPYGDYWYDTVIRTDLSASPLLAYSLSVSDATLFPEADMLPEGYDPCALIAWGMDPGLNVDILHAHGFTGKGAVIAYVDQAVMPHEQYSGENFHISNQSESNSVHGPAVLSLLAGKDTGVAPEAEVYFYGLDSGDDEDQLNEAAALYQIIEQNENLPEGEKITMVGFSDSIDPYENYEQEFRDAAAACEEAGIMVWFCEEYAPATFLPYGDKNDSRNLVIEQWVDPRFFKSSVYIPASGRTTAATMGAASYTYWAAGGLSWTMPYALGLYAIAIEIDPTLTQEELRTLLKETADPIRGMNLVNPVNFVSDVLRRVGRDEEADAIQREAQERISNGFTYVLWENSSKSARNYLSTLTDTTVLTVKLDAVSSGEELQAAIQADAAQRGGFVKELILFGDAAVALAPEAETGYPVTQFSDDGDIPQQRLPTAGPELAERTAAIRELAEQAAVIREPAEQSLVKIDETPRELPFQFTPPEADWEIHSFTAQTLEDGRIRFTLEYTVPEGLNRLVFDPPVGERISLSDWPSTSGERESIVFEIDAEELRQTGGVTISFGSDEMDMPVFLAPEWSKITLPG